MEQIGQDGAVEHDVAVIAHEGVALGTGLNAVVPECVARAALPENAAHQGFHVAQLELQSGVDAYERPAYEGVSHYCGQPRSQ